MMVLSLQGVLFIADKEATPLSVDTDGHLEKTADRPVFLTTCLSLSSWSLFCFVQPESSKTLVNVLGIPKTTELADRLVYQRWLVPLTDISQIHAWPARFPERACGNIFRRLICRSWVVVEF